MAGMLSRIQARRREDGVVIQTDRVRVHSEVYGRDLVGVGDLVRVNNHSRCPDNALGFIRELGADGFGDLIVRIDLVKTDPNSWPSTSLWVYPDNIQKTFTENWFQESP